MTSTDTTSAALSVSTLLARAVVDAGGQQLGRLADVIVRLTGSGYPPVTGLVGSLAGRPVFIDVHQVTDWAAERIELASPRVDLRAFERRHGEVLVRGDILGHRLVDVQAAQLVRAYDAQLVPAPKGGWVLRALDVHRVGWFRWPAHSKHAFRDWNAFEPLLGHEPSRRLRARFARLGHLRPAELADLIQAAHGGEQRELLDAVHADPELEADVFEELDDEDTHRILETRTDAQAAAILSRMRADDAADAIADLPQHRRAGVLTALPEPQQTRVRTLLEHSPGTAGGLMGIDYLALPATTTANAALDAVRDATTLQPEALACAYSLDAAGRLTGSVNIITLLQADPSRSLGELAEPDPVTVRPAADLIEIATLMTDYNLLTLPVVDDNDRILGVITVDDLLEVTLPTNWRHREPAPRHAHRVRPPTSDAE
jgi:CBS domain-containing protein